MPIYHNEVFNSDGELISEEIIEIPYPSLSGIQIVATLNAVLGIWSLEDAVNIARVPEEHLIAEAQAWAVAMEANK